MLHVESVKEPCNSSYFSFLYFSGWHCWDAREPLRTEVLTTLILLNEGAMQFECSV